MVSLLVISKDRYGVSAKKILLRTVNEFSHISLSCPSLLNTK